MKDGYLAIYLHI